MKQIYVVVPLYTFPPVAANQQDIVGRIKLFQELGYQVTIFPFPLPDQKFDIPTDEKNYGVKIEQLERKKDLSLGEYRLHRLWYKSSELINQESIDKLNRLVQQNKPDVLWFEYSALSPLAHAISKTYQGQIFFRYHNHELKHYLEKQYINLKDNPRYGLSIVITTIPNIIGIFSCERLMFRVTKKVGFISTEDMRYFKRRKNIDFLPYFPLNETERHSTNSGKDTIDVFYFGSDLENNVNKSGLDFIVKKIIPCLKERGVNFITFHILGKNPPEEYKSLNIPYLKLHGFVENLDKFLKDMDIAIVPVFYGMGFKVKAYESLQRGFPLVASQRALSNFNGVDGEDYLIAQKPEEFVEKLILLKDKDIRERLGSNASRLIERDFSKEKVIYQLKKILS